MFPVGSLVKLWNLRHSRQYSKQLSLWSMLHEGVGSPLKFVLEEAS